MTTTTQPRAWKTVLAFAIIYLVWGSTFLAIRVGVREVPPFQLAGMRFLAAGIVMFAWLRAKGTPSPSAREWGSMTLIAVPIFVLDYGGVFWAERRVPSGITAVMMATIPVFMALAEIVVLKTRRLTLRLGSALLLGMCGVAVLVSHTVSLGDAPIDMAGAAALIVAALGWTVGTFMTRKLPLPAAKAMSSGAQMLAGGVLLTLLSAGLGEFHGFRVQAVSGKAWLALVYLIVAGSIIAYTAYVWLIHRESPTKVGTYAYVNPVVAVILGYLFLGEAIGTRTILGTALILVSVVVITTAPATQVDLNAQMPAKAEVAQ